MSVSKWAYTPEVCDGGGCPGDCDLCDKPKNMEDEDDMTDYIKREDAIDAINKAEVKDIAVDRVRRISPADVRDDATAHKLVCGGERDGATCWFECDNCGLSVDIGDVFCKHCGARFVP